VVHFEIGYSLFDIRYSNRLNITLGKPLITMHDTSLIHPLKEVDAAAMAVAETPDQVVEILRYVTTKQ